MLHLSGFKGSCSMDLWPMPSIVHSPISHSARRYHNYPGASYILPSDKQEADRLRFQHSILKKTLEGRNILIEIQKDVNYFVLDSGTGTAIWLLDILSEFSPCSTFHGIDISRRLFPPSHPGNITLSVNSITALPEEWADRFDIVHQRLLIAALRRSEWAEALSEIHRVLAPGGRDQLGEAGKWQAGLVTARHVAMVDALCVSRELLPNVSSDLLELLRIAGFVNASVETRSIPLGKWAGQNGIDGRDDFINVFRGIKTPILSSGGFGFVSTEAEFDKLLDEVEEEWDRTPGAQIYFYVFTAQKPCLRIYPVN